jgi:hypothetical protein
VAYYLLILNFILEKPGLNPDEEDFLKWRTFKLDRNVSIWVCYTSWHVHDIFMYKVSVTNITFTKKFRVY